MRRSGGGSGKEHRAPRSVREAMDAPANVPTAIEDLPSSTFMVDGVGWIARLSGRTAVGTGSDRGAPLLHLTFFKSDDPTVAVSEALLPGESIDHLFETDLGVVLDSARPVRSYSHGSDASANPGRTPN